MVVACKRRYNTYTYIHFTFYVTCIYHWFHKRTVQFSCWASLVVTDREGGDPWWDRWRGLTTAARRSSQALFSFPIAMACTDSLLPSRSASFRTVAGACSRAKWRLSDPVVAWLRGCHTCDLTSEQHGSEERKVLNASPYISFRNFHFKGMHIAPYPVQHRCRVGKCAPACA